jgi:hypothetical protein
LFIILPFALLSHGSLLLVKGLGEQSFTGFGDARGVVAPSLRFYTVSVYQ